MESKASPISRITWSANAYPQPVDWKVENIGVFVQGSFKFGPYPTGGIF